jgi:5'-nucleotidase
MKKLSSLSMKSFLALSFCLLLQPTAFARKLHIIHTNDLHSYFVGYRNGDGGYAKLKTKIDELKNNSAQEGIEVLHLDAGDFGEGTSFFLSDEGVASVRALGMLGTEVAVIGNHDHMLGGKVLSQQIRRADINTKFVSANIVPTPDMELKDIVLPFVDIEKNQIKIRVIGLTTSDPHFQYPMLPGIILPAIPTGISQSDQAKKEGKELVIALTHIGQLVDVQLAKNSNSIDLIVGGHSHDRIEKVRWVENKKKRPVPIVQAGSHGLVVGSLMIEVPDNGPLKVLSYKLHEIKDDIKEDLEMVNFVSQAAENRNQYFGGRWEEIIGESLIPLTGHLNGKPVLKSSCWGEHMAKMTMEAAGSDIGVHLAAFEGEWLPAGPIRFGDIIDNYPHFTKYHDPGWEISKFQVNGKTLKKLLRAIINLKDDLGVNFYGVQYNSIHLSTQIPYVGERYLSFNFRVHGQRINNSQLYTLALPSEVGHALKALVPSMVQRIFPGLEDTGQFYWQVMEDYIKKNSPIDCL